MSVSVVEDDDDIVVVEPLWLLWPLPRPLKFYDFRPYFYFCGFVSDSDFILFRF